MQIVFSLIIVQNTWLYFPIVGFVTLANHVPTHLRSKKMSKVDTLKAAIVYIQELQQVLGDDSPIDSDMQSTSDEDSLTSLTDGYPSPPQSYGENPFYEENTPTSDCSESHLSPCSSTSSSPSYHPNVPPPYYQPSQAMYSAPCNSLSQQYPNSYQYPIQTTQWNYTSSPVEQDDYQPNAFNQNWMSTNTSYYPSDDTDEESILEMVSLMY